MTATVTEPTWGELLALCTQMDRVSSHNFVDRATEALAEIHRYERRQKKEAKAAWDIQNQAVKTSDNTLRDMMNAASGINIVHPVANVHVTADTLYSPPPVPESPKIRPLVYIAHPNEYEWKLKVRAQDGKFYYVNNGVTAMGFATVKEVEEYRDALLRTQPRLRFEVVPPSK